jgi:hypothetical protein
MASRLRDDGVGKAKEMGVHRGAMPNPVFYLDTIVASDGESNK